MAKKDMNVVGSSMDNIYERELKEELLKIKAEIEHMSKKILMKIVADIAEVEGFQWEATKFLIKENYSKKTSSTGMNKWIGQVDAYEKKQMQKWSEIINDEYTNNREKYISACLLQDLTEATLLFLQEEKKQVADECKQMCCELDEVYEAFVKSENEVERKKEKTTDVISLDDETLESVSLLDDIYSTSIETVDRELGSCFLYLKDVKGDTVSFDFASQNCVSYIVGKTASRTNFIKNVLCQMMEQCSLDQVRIWLLDLKGSEYSEFKSISIPNLEFVMVDKPMKDAKKTIERIYNICLDRKMSDRKPAVEYVNARPMQLVIIDDVSELNRMMVTDDSLRRIFMELVQNARELGIALMFADNQYDVTNWNDVCVDCIVSKIAVLTSLDNIKKFLTAHDKTVVGQIGSLLEKGLDSSEALYLWQDNKQERLYQLQIDKITAADVYKIASDL